MTNKCHLHKIWKNSSFTKLNPCENRKSVVLNHIYGKIEPLGLALLNILVYLFIA